MLDLGLSLVPIGIGSILNPPYPAPVGFRWEMVVEDDVPVIENDQPVLELTRIAA